MGLRFKTYFFELPGHGKSTPYPFKFNSYYFPKTVEAFADALGLKTFNLMGFSFGGLLALLCSCERVPLAGHCTARIEDRAEQLTLTCL